MENQERISRSAGVVWLILVCLLMLIMLKQVAEKPGIEPIGFLYGSLFFICSVSLIYQYIKTIRKTMKPLTIILLAFIVLASGCVSNDETRLNEFLSSCKRPVVVNHNNGVYVSAEKDWTLISADHKVLYIQMSHIILPDTIK